METLADDELDALARAFHDLYRRSSPDGVVGGTAWEDLGPEDRAANRASAGAVLGQAADMGYDVVRVTGTPEPVDLPASVVERASTSADGMSPH